MKITAIHGQLHKGSSYNISKQIVDKISSEDKEIFEYFMPKDTPDYCVGCYKCFNESENDCPHSEKVQTIVKSMEASDIIVIDSPTYCYEMTGQLKTFFDHLGYMWLPHRPKQAMFNKVCVVVSTASKGGAGKVTKALAQQMFWIGIPKVFQCGKTVRGNNWKSVPDKIKKSIAYDATIISAKAQAKVHKVHPGLRQKFIFNIMRMMQKSNDRNLVDHNYWDKNGWLNNNRPWKVNASK